jgi:hypothetical protein
MLGEFTDGILCLAIFCFVAWVVYLKLQVGTLVERNAELSRLLKLQSLETKKKVEVAPGRPTWGKKTIWTK